MFTVFTFLPFHTVKCSFAGTGVLGSVWDTAGKINTGDLLTVGLVRAFRTLPSPGDLQMGVRLT